MQQAAFGARFPHATHCELSHRTPALNPPPSPSDLMPRVATLPLGSGALAGNPFLVDRQVRGGAKVDMLLCQC